MYGFHKNVTKIKHYNNLSMNVNAKTLKYFQMLCISVHSSIIYYSQTVETTQISSTGKWINKTQYIDAMKYYSALKNNEIRIHTATWMNIEKIMLRKIIQMQKDKYYMILFI